MAPVFEDAFIIGCLVIAVLCIGAVIAYVLYVLKGD
jgi:hypothetical protein